MVYNDSIVAGQSVSQCIRNAVNRYPNNSMSTSVSIAGQPTTSITNKSIDSEDNVIKVSGIENMDGINGEDLINETRLVIWNQ